MKTFKWIAVAISSALLASCSGGNGNGLSWVGTEPHIVVRGVLDGEELDIDLRGADAVAAGISCRREYLADESATMVGEPDLTTAVFNEAKINAFITIDGVQREVEIELKQHDLQSTAVGSDITVVPRLAVGLPEADEMWLEWEWHTVPDDVTVLEVAAVSGTVTLESYTGTPGEGGVVIPEGDGGIGVTIDARWSPTESLQISITAPCDDVRVNLN